MNNEDLQARLKVPSWFTSPRFTAGIPRGAFIALVVASLFYGLVLAWWLGVLFFVVVYAPLVKAHRSDPAALRVWVYALSGGSNEMSVTRIRRLPIHME